MISGSGLLFLGHPICKGLYIECDRLKKNSYQQASLSIIKFDDSVQFLLIV